MIPRVFLITASTGIGAETARRLASLGHKLFIVSRREENCRALCDGLSSLGAESAWFAADLARAESAPAAVAACRERFGRIDGLYNVAGISGRKFGDGPLHECTEEGWHAVLETNATSQYRMSREVIRVMLDQSPLVENGQRGVVLNMASILGLHPEPRHFSAIAYAAAKGAIMAMTRTAAAFYAPHGIRLNAIAPALVQTPMSARASENPEILEFVAEKQHLTAGVIPVADAAEAGVFLLTDASRAITGEVLRVSAGWELH